MPKPSQSVLLISLSSLLRNLSFVICTFSSVLAEVLPHFLSLDLACKEIKLRWHFSGQRWEICITLPNFMKIIYWGMAFITFLVWRPLPSLIFINSKFNGRPAVLGQCASLCWISSKMDKQLQKYHDLTVFFKWRPSAILDSLGTYLDHSQRPLRGLYCCANLAGMDAIVLTIWKFLKMFVDATKNGVRYQQNPQNAHPLAERRCDTHRMSWLVLWWDLWACPRDKKRKERNLTVANWLIIETTHVIGSKYRLLWWVVLGW